jgi:hypothetical protein
VYIFDTDVFAWVPVPPTDEEFVNFLDDPPDSIWARALLFIFSRFFIRFIISFWAWTMLYWEEFGNVPFGYAVWVKYWLPRLKFLLVVPYEFFLLYEPPELPTVALVPALLASFYDLLLEVDGMII